ncbi:lipoprotein NlpI [Pleomorphomonas sp. SM30]|uniref:FecR family protein n=4 Tax=Oharaeibacter diazotrophicus TaxID=1920512 RepID=A0A4V3CWG7_9HYPH|nr:FecR family protein [Oharaeibacter diazotrophicus]BBE71769.1 lipoprotein NlpI [Pleomorphomonas sp. SM30]GLS78535.1 TonB-dependent receptor [Oharaeibacter diazotrophicus]
MRLRNLVLTTAAAVYASAAAAEIVPRDPPVAGTVVAVKRGEQLELGERPGWIPVEVRQEVRTGDGLRTNAEGQLAVLFADQTQLRIGRNTTMRIKELRPNGDSRFDLSGGTIWARAARGGSAVTVETPAAAAAIRGTDWTLTVGPDRRTSLIVLEGKVELANAQGSVVVQPGEAATVAVGEAPTKTVVVRPDDREQMLYYMPIRYAFQLLSAHPGSTREQREERARIDAIPPAARGVADAVARAEIAFGFDSRADTRAAVAAARALRPSPAEAARLDLVEGLLAANEGRYAAAAATLRAAQPRLDPKRRTVALYAAHFADTLAHPDRPSTPPAGFDSPYAATAAAYGLAFREGVPAAIDLLKEAERRWPTDSYLPAARSQLAAVVDDRAQTREAYERALALDPQEPMALESRSYYRSAYESDLAGALADARAAAAIQPGSASIWNAVSLAYDDRDATRESEAAIRRSIELDPEDPLGHANYALMLLEQNRMEEARAEIDRALALDPAFDVAYVALGRWYLQKGDMPAAIEALLKGSTANPTYSQALLLLAAAYYQNDQDDPAWQALDNADRLDPNDPLPSIVRSGFAIDAYEADVAIAAAREALRRSESRGGWFATLGANADALSTVADAMRFAGLSAWADYYGDRSFSRFDFSGYNDAAAEGNATAFTDALARGDLAPDRGSGEDDFSILLQGLLHDPLAIGATLRRRQLLHAPFLEAETIGGLTFGEGRGWSSETNIQAFALKPFPFGLSANLTVDRFDGNDSNVDDRLGSLSVILGATPTPYDRVTSFVTAGRQHVATPGVWWWPTPDDLIRSDAVQTGTTWSHTIGWRNVVNAAVTYGDRTDRANLFDVPTDGEGTLADFDAEVRQRVVRGSLQHMIGGDAWSFVYGLEGGGGDERSALSTTTTPPGGDPSTQSGAETRDFSFARAYGNLRFEPNRDLAFEVGLDGTFHDTGIAESDGGGRDQGFDLGPRVGVAWSFYEGQWLRAFAERDVDMPGLATLEPIGAVGLRPYDAPLDSGATADTVGAKWEAEWSDNLFTAIEYQHQWLERLSITNPGTLETYTVADGEVDRLTASANLLLGHGFGAFATLALARSDDGTGADIPYVPETMARVGLAYVDPARWRVTLSGTYVGERLGDDLGTRLDEAFTVDAKFRYEPDGGRFVFDVGLYNILDKHFDIAPDTPGWGRTVEAKLAVRF